MGNFFNKKEIETKEINKYVKLLIQNKEVNIKIIPDSIEEKIYQELFEIIINNLKQALETLKIEFLNYEIQIKMIEKISE